MKIFSVKRALGLAAIYAGVQYARKNGGFAKVFEDLKAKAVDLKDQAQQTLGQVTGQKDTLTDAREPTTSTGYGTTSGIGGSSYTGGYGNGFGGGSTNRH